MKTLSKLLSVFKNSVNEKAETVLDNVIDIKREGNAIIAASDRKVEQLKARLQQAQQTVCSNKNEIDSINLNIDKLNIVASLAVKAGNDDDAIQALTRIELLEQTIESLKSSNNILEPIIDQQVSYIMKLNDQRNSLVAEIQRMDIEEKAYKLREEMLGGGNASFGINIDDLRDRVKKAKAAVDAKEIIVEKLGENDLTQKYEVKDVNKKSVQDRLDALKAKKK